jgi:hypothetical protein
MAMRERVQRYTDRPMTWTKAIVIGTLIWVFTIAFTGQLPSWIIYWFDANVATLTEWSAKLPIVPEAGLNPKQIAIVRDLVANGVQIGVLVGMLVVAYFWQKSKQKRTGARGLQDPVKGYLSGK